jgi:hypothetical protein
MCCHLGISIALKQNAIGGSICSAETHGPTLTREGLKNSGQSRSNLCERTFRSQDPMLDGSRPMGMFVLGRVPVEKPIMSQKVIEEGTWGLNGLNVCAASWSKHIGTQLNFLEDITKYIHTQLVRKMLNSHDCQTKLGHRSCKCYKWELIISGL